MKKTLIPCLLWMFCAAKVCAFLNNLNRITSHPFSHKSVSLISTDGEIFSVSNPDAQKLKEQLLKRIDELRTAKLIGGDFSIDFGVKGGELNETSRAPQKVDFYSISDSVGYAADGVLSVCEKLASMNPTKNATMYLGDPLQGEKSPLEGPWKLLFSTAADATFSSKSKRGDARVQNIVNAKKGRITNVIDFLPSKTEDKAPVLKQLNVAIKAIPVSERRVELQFKYAKAVFSRFFFIPIKWSLYIPVPGPFITRIVVFFNRFLRRRKGAKMPPKGYFDILYLDDELRIHKTGEDNIFVQARDSWAAARRLLK